MMSMPGIGLFTACAKAGVAAAEMSVEAQAARMAVAVFMRGEDKVLSFSPTRGRGIARLCLRHRLMTAAAKDCLVKVLCARRWHHEPTLQGGEFGTYPVGCLTLGAFATRRQPRQYHLAGLAVPQVHVGINFF
jgi:hypothetical protein